MRQQQPEISIPEIPWPKIAKFLPLIVIVAIALYLITGCFYTVQNDSEAVVTRFGKYTRTTIPGLHYRWPWPIEQVQIVQTQKVQSTEFGFRTERAGRDTRYAPTSREDKDVSLMLTGDLNLAVVEWIVQYRIDNPKDYLFNLKAGEKEDAVRDAAETAMRRIVGDSSIDEVITSGRDRIASDARRVIQDMLDSFDAGIEVRVVKLQAARPPDEVESAFNAVNQAKQEQEKIINDARKERNQKIPVARGERDEMILAAEGYKSRVVQEASGEVSAFLAQLEEYEKAPEVTRERLYLEALEEVMANVGKTTIVDDDLKGVLPLLQLQEQGKGGGQ
jgi:membrane protease subunit HflK